MGDTELDTPIGRFTIRRGATPPDSPLRAWSAADRLAIEDALAHGPTQRTASGATSARILVVNDAWGAVTVPIVAQRGVAQVSVWNDSALARRAIAANLAENELPNVEHVPGDRWPTGHFDGVVFGVPKSHDLLEWQARGVATIAGADTRVVVAGMSRHLGRLGGADGPGAVVELLERHLGAVRPRRAVGKARLLDIDPPVASSRAKGADPIGDEPAFTIPSGVRDRPVRVFGAPGVFSAGHLDVGTALLLHTLLDGRSDRSDAPFNLGGVTRIADLGCGNGVLGTTLAVAAPDAEVTFFDASDLALAAARATWMATGLGDRARFVVADGMPQEHGSFDLVVSNPPFHHGHAFDEHLTGRLLTRAVERLVPGGQLVFVAQRHLELHRSRRLPPLETLSGHPSHVVFATRR
ncbi:MAG: methyltransferase [Actinomycetota bacterium]